MVSWFNDVQDWLRRTRSLIFPQQLLLELDDASLKGQVFKNNWPQPLSIEAQLPPLTCRDGLPAEKEPLGDLIGDLLVRDGLIDVLIVAALPAPAVQWRVFTWPFQAWPEDPAEALRRLDPALNLSMPLEELYIDLQPMPNNSKQILLAAASKACVDGWIEVFNLAGAQLERLAPSQSCQLLALAPVLEDVPEQELVVLLEPKPGGCRLLFLRKGIPEFERWVPEEINLVRELRRCLDFYRKCDKQAEGLKLLVSEAMASSAQLEEAFGVPLLEVPAEPFGSLVLEGLSLCGGN